MKKGTLAVFDEEPHASENSDSSTAENSTAESSTDDKEPDAEEGEEESSSSSSINSSSSKLKNTTTSSVTSSEPELVREKKAFLDGQEAAIYDYYTNMRKKADKKTNKYKKVQVQEEETGTQRVQVNAGYENPRIACESGYNSCSGVVLKWVLTLYGTGE